MPLMFNEKLGRLTDHEDLGLNPKGKHQFRCKETGDIRVGSTKLAKDKIRSNRQKRLEQDFKDFESGEMGTPGQPQVSNDNVQKLRDFLKGNE